MAITREQLKVLPDCLSKHSAPNERGNEWGGAHSRLGPLRVNASRYDSRRGLIVITLKGGCEFAFPVALAEGLADAPRAKLARSHELHGIPGTDSGYIGRCLMPICMCLGSSKVPSAHVGGCSK